jgi:hypothetical protein
MAVRQGHSQISPCNASRRPELLAEIGIPPESAAVSLKAAKEALLKCMTDTKTSL